LFAWELSQLQILTRSFISGFKLASKKLTFIIILIVLITPLIEQAFNFIGTKPLNGAVVNSSDISFSLKNWFAGDYQKTKEQYLNEHFGFRNIFLRLSNQIDFSLFKKVHAKGVIVGGKNYLYELDYIRAFTGKDFLGTDSIIKNVSKIKLIQDSLKKRNIDLLIVFAPGKASFFPEFIPEKYLKDRKDSTNYQTYVDEFARQQVNFLDFNGLFMEQKSKSTYPLYPQYGIHWSDYGSIVAFDSLLKFIEVLKKKDIPDLLVDKINIADTISYNDYDAAAGMNLLMHLSTYKMAYPQVSFRDSGKTRVPSLTIADSYNWSFFGTGYATRIFSSSHFWFGYNQLYSDTSLIPMDKSKINLKNELETNSIIIVMATEANYSRLGWGFFEDAYKLYSHEEANNRIDAIMESIKRSPAWLETVKEKALHKGISLDSMIYLDAKYVYEQEKK
jgi:hypothetical protein